MDISTNNRFLDSAWVAKECTAFPASPFPLSSDQQAIWFAQTLNPELTNYNIGSVMIIDGNIVPDIIVKAFDSVIKRHDVFRLRMVAGTSPAQYFDSSALPLMEFKDFSTTDNPINEAEQYVNLNFTQPFNLAERLWRSALIFAGNNRWYWQLCCHHIIADGTSLSLLNAELSENYSRLIRGEHLSESASLSYTDFVASDAAYLGAKQCIKDQAFWLERYTALPPQLFQPLVTARTPASYLPEPVSWMLEESLFQRIEQAASLYGLSVLHFMYALFACYFKRVKNVDDIVFGIPLHNRKNARQKAAVGMYASVIPVRIRLTEKDSFSDVMQKAADELRICYKHQRLPITEINRRIKKQQHTDRANVFDMSLSYEPYDVNIHLEGATIQTIKPHHRAQYPLAITINQYAITGNNKQSKSVCVEFNYSLDYFTPADIQVMQSRLAVLLEGALQNVDTPVSLLPVLSPHERQQLLQPAHVIESGASNLLVHEMFEAQVRRSPQAIAAVFEGSSLTYDALNRRANRLAHQLIRLGVHPNDRVAICLERGLNMVIGILGILKAGGAYVPLDPVYPGERLNYMLEDSAPAALVTHSALAQTLNSATPAVLMDAPLPAVADEDDESNPVPLSLGLAAHHLAYVIYTSGSTGQPKGVMVEHRNITRLLTVCQPVFSFSSKDTWSLCHSFSFDFSVWELFGALCSGGRLIVVSTACARSPQTLYALLCREQVTVLNQTPSAFRQLIAAQDSTSHTLRCIIFGGEALEMRSLVPWINNASNRNTRLINMYGITEITVHATWYEIAPSDITSHGASLIGGPLSDLRIYILDSHRQLVPFGVTGELYIAGNGVARGYLNRPELTAERFLPDPFTPGQRMYRTGDLGRWLPDGNIEFLGRNDFQVKLRGFRIEPGEISACLTECDGVRDAVVMVREDTPGDKRLVAYLLAEPGHTPEPARLRQQLAQSLAEHMMPAAFVTLESFPLTPTGKLDRQALPAPDRTAVVTRGDEPPAGEVETALAAIWCELLGLAQVGRQDNFFELGGHSLMVVSLLERLRGQGMALDIRGAFSAPVLAEMAQRITVREAESPVPPPRIPAHCRAITPGMLPLVSLTQAETDAVVETVDGGAANVQDIYPLSPLQEGILFHHLLQAQGDAYLLSSLLAFDSRVLLEAFLAALQQVIDRHDILRSAVCWQGVSRPVQVVWRQAVLPVTAFVPQTGQDVAGQLRAQASPHSQRMDVSRAPLFSARTAYDPAQQRWLLALNFHHLVCDHISMALVCDEITQILDGNAAALAAPVPYRNFIARTLRVPQSEHEAWFRARLADTDTPTAPYDIADTRESGGVCGEARQTLDTALAGHIRAQARRLGVSPGVLFHTALARLLAQLCGRDDVVFGTVLMGRLQAGDSGESGPGMFINTLPLRVSLAGQGVQEAVLTTRDALAALCEHEQAPLALALRCSGVPQPLPLFSTLLNYRHSPARSNLVREGIRLLEAEERTSYPLAFSVDDTGEGFILTAQTVAGIDPQRQLGYLLTTLAALSAALAHEPQRPVLSLPVLPEGERNQVLVAFNATRAAVPAEGLVHRLFEAQVARTPEAVAVVCDDITLSYAALNRRANRLAHRLMALGVRPDDRVAVCLPRSADVLVAILGILKAGGAYVPLDPAYPVGRLNYMLADASPVALVTQRALVQTLNTALPVVLTDAAPEDGVAEHNPEPQGLTAEHLAYVIYTSGSTGKPKGVMVEHRNVVSMQSAIQVRLGIQHPSRVSMNASIVFDASVQSWVHLLLGHTMVIVPEAVRKEGGALLAFLRRQRVDVIDCTPLQLQGLIAAGLQKAYEGYPCTVIIGGDAIPLSAWSAMQNIEQIRFVNAYGPTECTVNASMCVVDKTLATPCIGKPLDNTQIYFLDDHGQPVPLGICGELYIAGNGVARGYLNRPELTAERFLPDPFTPGQRMYRTGDLGRWLPDGNIEFLGRNDFQVKLRGFRIEPGEIEACLTACAGVRDAVVIAREETPGDKRLVAYLLAEPGHTPEPARLRQQLAQSLAEYMLPAAYVTLESFPLTPNGKLDRQALPAPDRAALVTRGDEPPAGEVENMLAAIWCELLGLSQVGRHDNFFELGGHSLLAVQLLNRMAKTGLAISLATLFARPSLAQLAGFIQDREKSLASPFADNPVVLRGEGTQPPLFLVHEPSGDPLVYSPLATMLRVDRPVYALSALGLHNAENPPTSLEALAACHIEAIRRVQPHGPYHLAGWSLGGVISYEIALQLQRSGEEIAFIGMIDSYHPAAHQKRDVSASSEPAVRDEMIVNFLSMHVPESERSILAQLQSPLDMQAVFDLCSEHNWLPKDIGYEDLLLRLETVLYIRPLGLRYQPIPADLTINLYTANLEESDDIWRGWHGTVSSDSSLHVIGGSHLSIMQPPLLAQLAKTMSADLLPRSSYQPVVVMQAGADCETPLFCIPGAGASAFSFLDVVGLLPATLPVYALQARGLTDVKTMPHLTIEETARDYISAMRERQPSGPYHLIGHSFGGWIAFEIALQLQAQGETVADLIIIDSRSPGAKPPVSHLGAVMKLISIYNLMLNRELPITEDALLGMAPQQRLICLHQLLIEAGVYTRNTPLSLLAGVFHVLYANLNTSYIPRARYQGRLHSITAQEANGAEREQREAVWREYATQFTAMLSPGNHMTMLTMPHAGALADHITTVISQP
ncbi:MULTISPECIES: non-ribosomal peptide synthetase [Kosakonia]|uniref:non-ribosomal peptide synthetase n=1 Tax=Kosakonia TaxID=1330547 RepID=UPI0009E5DC4B|nr:MULTISPECIES: non-ribosomal peptide synthetase [Kosakonia]RCW99774.1 amino acid adenylation domain-containing protein [Kosakonia sp. AG348]